MSALMEAARNGIEVVRLTLGPEDDWSPIMLVQTRGGENVPVLLGPAGDDDLDVRDAFWESVIPSLLVEVGAVEAVIVMSAWVSKLPAGTDLEDVGRPTLDPNRIDALVLCRVTLDEEEYEAAEVDRSTVPPTLDWDADLAEGFTLGGRVVGSLRRGLAEA